MNKKIVTILLISLALFLNACQKNIDIFVPDPVQGNGLDTTWNTTISATAPVFSLQASLLLAPVKDSFEITANPITITTSNGVQLSLPPNSCVSNTGTPITGKVYVEVQLIKSKGDMIMMNKPTSSNGSLLVSGGEIFVSLKKDGKEVKLAPNTTISIKYADGAVNTSMHLFYGDELNSGSINWIPNVDTTNKLIIGQQVYEIISNRLRWINCDYFFDTTNITRSVISAVLPSSYTNANTAVFLVFKELRSVLNMYGDVPEKRFLSNKVPNGKVVTIVAISKQGNDYFLGKELITTGVNVSPSNVQKVNLSPVKKSLADIKAFLATL